MEDFKDVMLSEPPQRYTGASAAPMTSNALSLESYKGILLCDRPADMRAARHGQSQQQPFLPPGNTDMDRGNGNLGLPPSLEARAKNVMNRASRGDTQNRSRNTALSRHRKWLQSFATEMKKMQEEKTEAQIRQTVREATLRGREAAKRKEGAAAADCTVAVAAPSTPPEPPKAQPPAAAATASKAKKGKSKPKWAMTDEEAEDAEFAEARDLVDFAAELDFDSFIKDFEVQEALAIMRDRVKEIAAEKGIDLETARRARRKAEGDEDDEDDTASVATASTTTREIRRAAKRASKARTAADGEDAVDGDRPVWDDSTNTTIHKALEGDALKLAERVLQSSEALRKVHSKMSMARLLEEVALEMNAGKTQRQVTLPSECVVIPPRVAMIAAEATGAHGTAAPQPQKRILTEMRHSKTMAQNLPYLYRCPSI